MNMIVKLEVIMDWLKIKANKCSSLHAPALESVRAANSSKIFFSERQERQALYAALVLGEHYKLASAIRIK